MFGDKNMSIYFLALFSRSSYTVSSVGSVIVDNMQRTAVFNANNPYKTERIIYLEHIKRKSLIFFLKFKDLKLKNN